MVIHFLFAMPSHSDGDSDHLMGLIHKAEPTPVNPYGQEALRRKVIFVIF